MNELMRDEILDQPDALQQTLSSMRSQLTRLLPSLTGVRRIVFTGAGDSFFAPLALEYAARRFLTANTHVLPAQEAGRYWPFESNDLVVPISISGEAGRTVEAAYTAREAGAFVLAVTANENSSLAETSTEAAIIPFRSRSRKTPHTTDYLATLLAIATLIEALGEHHFTTFDDLPKLVAQSLESLEVPCHEVGQTLAGSERFYFLGAGPSFGVTQYAAAKFWEAGGLRGFAFQLEEFAHGPHLLLDRDDPVFLVSPDGQCLGRAITMVEGLQQIGLNIFVITDKPEAFSGTHILHIPSIAEMWSPFLTSLPTQWICWAVATAKGYDVVSKDGRHPNPEVYELAHREWVRDSGKS